MKKLMVIAAITLTAAIASNGASAAPGDSYKARTAACQERAKSMNFGIHLIKKNRWVKDCVAGKHRA